MTIKLRYAVHSANPEKMLDPAKTDAGRLVMAPVPALVVEMVSDGNEHGHTFRLKSDTDEQYEEMLRVFKVGAIVEITFSPEGVA